MVDLSEITAMILAGGEGTRLRGALPPCLPKALAPVCGRPFVSFILEWLARAGIRRAVLCTGFGGDAVEETLGAGFGPVSLSYSREVSPLGTGGALGAALEIAPGDPLLAVNGDTLAHQADLSDFAGRFFNSGAEAAILLCEATEAISCGLVETDSRGGVTSFREKPESVPTGPGQAWASAGVYLFCREFLSKIPSGRPVSLEREILPGAAGRGLFGFKTHGRFLDIGTPETYLAARRLFS